ncbi:MAG: glycosyl hydrolase family 18 protein [Lentimicrobium sp.]|jgi:GH18 family chitinase|nr:glycosyl hydrolase family 18 protein [Lentimicrobium sp.]
MIKLILAVLLLANCYSLAAQSGSIHQQQSESYSLLGKLSDEQYDSINGFELRKDPTQTALPLQKRVFGYHPYWSGNLWQNYRWDLLSDLCYFSYEVDPATGEALTTHDWSTAPVIDTALVHGVKVHLCVTLFSGHASFFSNPLARQTLTANLIELVSSRGANGINLDFEAVPSSQQQGLTDYIIQLSQALHAVLPLAELSIAAPAVNWSNTFDLPAISPWLDLVMVMAYDYYWNGSDLAGPVSGFWPMTASFNYGVNSSLSYYQSMGVPEFKLLLGLPYYGREWPVNSNVLPASTTGQGTAITYKNIRGNTTYYNPSNYYWDYRSFNPYYSYFTTHWRQCFFDDEQSLGAKYDLVNRRGVAGIGIWALGYDNGYSELWNLIEQKFSLAPQSLCEDTAYDTGGPWWNYSNNESYTETIQSAWPGPLSITFSNLALEAGYDSLWIYDGLNTDATLLAALSGNAIPPEILTSGNAFTLKFASDALTVNSGYELIWKCPTAGIEDNEITSAIKVFPNPVNEFLNVLFSELPTSLIRVSLLNMKGQNVLNYLIQPSISFTIPVKSVNSGLYILKMEVEGQASYSKVFILRN